MDHSGKYSKLITLAASVIVIAALYLARAVLIPFVLAMLVSFLLAPLVLRLQRWHLRRLPAVIAVLILVFGLTGALGWLVTGQVRHLSAELPKYRQGLQAKMASLREVLDKPFRQAKETVADLSTGLAPPPPPEAAASQVQTVRIEETPRGPLEFIADVLSPAIDILITAAMVLLFAFVMLLRREDLGDRFMRLTGSGQIVVTTQALNEASKKVSSYLARLLLLNGVHGAAVGIGLALIGVPNALLWGLLAGVLRFIPYVGPWLAASFPLLSSIATSVGWSQPLMTIGLFAVLELISNNLLEPWIYGRGTGISPLAILVSTLFWTWLWGPVGLVLSTPLTVCLVVIGKYVPQLHFLNLLFGDAPGLPPPARLYQRMIAGDQDQAWCVLEAEMRDKPLDEVYDGIVLPALSMAEHDRKRGALDEEAVARVVETLKLLLDEASAPRAELDAGANGIEAPLPRQELRVLCLPARGEADFLAGVMLGQVLERDGIEVEVAQLAELASETLVMLEDRPVDVVCISAVPPSRFMHVRYLCKRIAGRYPDLPIVAGMWTLDLEAAEVTDRLRILEGVHVVASLGEARRLVRELTGPARIRREVELAEAAVLAD
jgi:predicted PurR-regulated permease PerM